MKLKLSLVLSVILQAVKDETHHKATFDRSVDDKAIKMAYNEEAGDEEFHDRKLLRGIYTSLDNLKAELAEYLDNIGYTVADNVIETSIDEDTDAIIILLDVNRSFNRSFTDSLARLCSKYIEDNTLYLWWGPINLNQAQFYQSLVQLDIASLRKAFVKRSNKSLDIPYSAHLSLSGTTIEMCVGEHDTVTYTIDEDCIDDIEIMSHSRKVLWKRLREGTVVLWARHPGVAHIKFFSTHDESVCKTLDVIIHEPNFIDNNG